MSRADKLRVLYSNQFAFDPQGVPLITVRIADGETTALIESSAPVRVFPDGEDGSEVTGGRRWKVILRQGTPAQLEHFVVLAQEPVSALEALRSQMRTWQARGARCRLIEIGTVFGVKGQVFDNRTYLLVDGPYPSAAAARTTAERYHRTLGLEKVATVPQLKQRPAGRFEAIDQESSARVLVRDAIWFAPAAGAQLTVSSDHSAPARYWGQIYVTVDREGKLAVVNSLPASQLLAGLVPAEIFPNAPMAALQAQAVAARGELLAKLGTRHLVDPYLLCSTQHCQVYRGAGYEHPRTTAAVQQTKGMVLVRPDGRLVDTVYSASCGGHTEHNDNAWPVHADPNLRGQLDAASSSGKLQAFRQIDEHNIAAWLAQRPQVWCNHPRYNRDKLRWEKRFTAAQANALLRELGIGELRELKVLARGTSGRALLLEVRGTRGHREVRGELEIRKLFGGLPSSMFVVQLLPEPGDQLSTVLFRGGGWGHGVGMCQTGAIGMADAGKSYREILLHYYPSSELHPLY